MLPRSALASLALMACALCHAATGSESSWSEAADPFQSTPAEAAGDASGKGLADRSGRWVFQTSAFTKHFNPDPRHTNRQRAIDIEYWTPDEWVWGATSIRNSFNQPTQYIYAGRIWRPFERDHNIFVKLTGGLLHGYKGEFRSKIPFNQAGIAPALVPSIGYSYKRVVGEVILLGAAAVMVSVGFIWD